MKKKIILGTILVLSLAITVAVAAVTPALANPPASNTVSGNSGTVTLQLPPGGGALASRPVDIRLEAFDYDRNSYGGADVMLVYIWVSTLNYYIPIAAIGDKAPSPELKAFWNSTPVYLEVNGVAIRNNLKTVADKELDVWTETMWTQYGGGSWGYDEYGRCVWNIAGAQTLKVNLTVPVGPLDYTGLPAIFGSTFTVPSMSLMFTGIADGSPLKETSTMPSGFKYEYKTTAVPAHVKATIPTWIGSSTFAAGGMGKSFTMTSTPPA